MFMPSPVHGIFYNFLSATQALYELYLSCLVFVPLTESAEDESHRILYNSTLTFSKRLYGSFSLRLERFVLRKPVKKMISWDEVYLRERIPLFVVEGLQILNRVRCWHLTGRRNLM